jgi:hypothetical protein
MGCPYANLLGEVGKGVHATRIFGFSWNDIWMTVVAALISSFLFNISWWKSIIAWFIAGEILHYVYGVNSAFLERVGLSPDCSISLPNEMRTIPKIG